MAESAELAALRREVAALRGRVAELEAARVDAPRGEEAAPDDARAEAVAAESQARAMEALGRMAAGVAHDISNLVTVLQLQLAAAERTGSLREAGTALDSARELVGRLLAFGRRGPLHRSRCEVADLVERAVRRGRAVLGPELTLVARVAPDLPALEADITLLEQAIHHLQLNARDASPAGGEVVLEALPGERAGWVRIAVRDRGPGVPSELRPRMFEPFFSTNGRGTGAGLGLAVVYGTAAQHGGAVGCIANPGGGAAFTLDLPALPRRADGERPAEPRGRDRSQS